MPLDSLTRFYECLLNPRSAIFEKSERFVQIFEYIFFFSKETFVTQISASGRPWNDFFLDDGPWQNTILGVLDVKRFEKQGFL